MSDCGLNGSPYPEAMMENIDELVELDQVNMAPLIERAGGRFDPAFRREKILVEVERGALFLCIRRAGRIVAYLEYLPEQTMSGM